MVTLLADTILVFHFLFVVFVVGGQVCILAGAPLGWQWVRMRGFRIAHLVAIAVVIAQSWIGIVCPLTAWESALRRMAGEAAYEDTFLSHWVGRALYFTAPAWVFTTVYSLFGLVVLASWFLVRPTRGKGSGPSPRRGPET